jgi:hypothetical protein
MESSRSIKLAYILLLVVMGGRTALFTSKLDSLFTIDGLNLTPLSILLALALILTVSGAAYARGKSGKNERVHGMATYVMIGGVVLDGILNISEAVYLADGTGVFDQFVDNRFVLYWMWGTTILVGVGPTLLATGLAMLAGEIDRTNKPTVRTETKLAIAYQRTTATNPALDAHFTRVSAQLTPGQEFTREQVEQWTGKSKQHAVNVVNYAKGRGVVSDVRRGVYVYKGEVSNVE